MNMMFVLRLMRSARSSNCQLTVKSQKREERQMPRQVALGSAWSLERGTRLPSTRCCGASLKFYRSQIFKKKKYMVIILFSRTL